MLTTTPRHLDFVRQYTTDIRHISGMNNVVADALSRVQALSCAVNYDDLAEDQKNDTELSNFIRNENTGLQLKQVALHGTNSMPYGDISLTHRNTDALHSTQCISFPFQESRQ